MFLFFINFIFFANSYACFKDNFACFKVKEIQTLVEKIKNDELNHEILKDIKLNDIKYNDLANAIKKTEGANLTDELTRLNEIINTNNYKLLAFLQKNKVFLIISIIIFFIIITATSLSLVLIKKEDNSLDSISTITISLTNSNLISGTKNNTLSITNSISNSNSTQPIITNSLKQTNSLTFETTNSIPKTNSQLITKSATNINTNTNSQNLTNSFSNTIKLTKSLTFETTDSLINTDSIPTTNTNTNKITNTNTNNPTESLTYSNTNNPTNTNTNNPTVSSSKTDSLINTDSISKTNSMPKTNSITKKRTNSQTSTDSLSFSNTNKITNTNTNNPTNTRTNKPTDSLSFSNTNKITNTKTNNSTDSSTFSNTNNPTNTNTNKPTNSLSFSKTTPITNTNTNNPTDSLSNTNSMPSTNSMTGINTNTHISSNTLSNSLIFTSSATEQITKTLDYQVLCPCANATNSLRYDKRDILCPISGNPNEGKYCPVCNCLYSFLELNKINDTSSLLKFLNNLEPQIAQLGSDNYKLLNYNLYSFCPLYCYTDIINNTIIFSPVSNRTASLEMFNNFTNNGTNNYEDYATNKNSMYILTVLMSIMRDLLYTSGKLIVEDFYIWNQYFYYRQEIRINDFQYNMYYVKKADINNGYFPFELFKPNGMYVTNVANNYKGNYVNEYFKFAVLFKNPYKQNEFECTDCIVKIPAFTSLFI